MRQNTLDNALQFLQNKKHIQDMRRYETLLYVYESFISGTFQDSVLPNAQDEFDSKAAYHSKSLDRRK